MATRGGRTIVQVKLRDLRPTQMSIGYGEVALKRKEWKERSAAEAKQFLKKHLFPAVVGPKGRFYIVDHHHLGRALLEERVKRVGILIVADISKLQEDEFWIVMDYNRWVHPYDEKGRHRDYSKIPKSLTRLPDDPYRSLSAEVRRVDEYPKGLTPFCEFLWADFFRRRIPIELLRASPRDALRRASNLARKEKASHLPGWMGISENSGGEGIHPAKQAKAKNRNK